MNWTDERKEQLKVLWTEQGKSASQCAAILNETRAEGDVGLSRSAVIGMVHRLKLSAHQGRQVRPKAPPKPPREPRPVVIKAAAPNRLKQQKLLPMLARISHAHDAPAPIVVRGRAWEALPNTEPRPLEKHRDHECRWPLGDPLEPGFTFCCAPVLVVKDKERPYCEAHDQLSRRQL